MKKTLWEKAKHFFDTHHGVVSDMELCSTFDDREVHELYMGGYIEPLDSGQAWQWIRAQAAQR